MIFKMTIRCMIAATVAMLTGCVSVTHVTEPEAKRVLVEFFRSVDFEVYNRESFRDLITDDFHIYEAGKHMSRSEFFKFLSKAHIRKRRSQTIGNFQTLTSPPIIAPPISATKTWEHLFQEQRTGKNQS